MIRSLGRVSAVALTLMLVVYPAFAESPLTIQNAVGNVGNTSSTAAVNTRGNTNQNNNQNSVGLSNTTSQTLQGLNIGGISISAPTTAGEGGTAAAAAGAGEGYVGYSGSVNFASPAITFGNSRVTNVNLPGLPGIPGSPGNFSQPYKPDVFINGAGPVRPTQMTYEQAAECRGGMGYKDTYTGASRGRAKDIKLVYAAWDKVDIVNDISNYVGITSVEGADKPWLPAVCEAAYHAMEKGANYGVVEFIIRPKNTMKGFGFGSSGGGSVVPNVATAASPYGLAATLGFGVGWSSQRVEGEIMIQITGLKMAPTTTGTAPVTPAAPVVPAAATPPHIVVPNGKAPVKLPTPVSPTPAPVPQPEPRSSDQDPAAAEPADFNAPAGPRNEPVPVTKAPTPPAPTSKAPSSPAPTSQAPTSPAPTAAAPANQPPANGAPTSSAPASPAPTSQAPANQAPVSQAPAGPAPTSQAPANQAPVSQAPASQPPASQAPSTFNAPADPSAAEPANYNIPTPPKNLVNGSANGRPPR